MEIVFIDETHEKEFYSIYDSCNKCYDLFRRPRIWLKSTSDRDINRRD